MLRDLFHNLANQIESVLDGSEHEAGAFLLVHALNTAQDHDAGSVRAFAFGGDDNDFADAMNPMLTIHGLNSGSRVRGDLREIFEQGGVSEICARLSEAKQARGHTCTIFERHMDAMSIPEDVEIEAPELGLMRYLGFAKREDPQLVVTGARGRGDATVYRLALAA